VSVLIYASEIPTYGSAVFSFDAEADETRQSPAKVTDYAVDSGFEMCDGVSLQSRKWRVSGTVTCTPLTALVGPTWAQLTGPGRVSGAGDALRKLQVARQPVFMSTRFWGAAVWIGTVEEKMGLDTGDAVDVTIECTEVRRAVATTASVPAAKLSPSVSAQATSKPTSGGAAGKKDAGSLAVMLAKAAGWVSK
jgi:hypothetical protein